MIRRIGRFDSDASPIIVVENGQAARMPASRRIVVPEFAASIGVGEARSPARPRPWMVTAPGAVSSIRTPSARMHAIVAATSAPGDRCVTDVTPCAMDPSIR